MRGFGRGACQLILSLLALLTVTFFLLRALPGGPFDRAVPFSLEQKAQIAAQYGMDLPISRQYFRYLGKALHLDLGTSFRYEGAPVAEILFRAAPVSFVIGILSFFWSLAFGIPLGIESARRGGWFDAFSRLACSLMVSLPAYLSGALLIYFFSLRWNLLPAAFWGSASQIILPVITLSLAPTAQVARLVRASELENIGFDYVRTARAKGAAEISVYWHHAFRNSLLPLLSMAAPLLVNLVAGTFIVESLFSLPGMGHLFVESVANRDYPLVMALTLFYGALLITANILLERIFAWADPRLEGGMNAR